MSKRPTATMRRQVIERAHECCEYCLIHQSLAASRHQVDHVIAEKHGAPARRREDAVPLGEDPLERGETPGAAVRIQPVAGLSPPVVDQLELEKGLELVTILAHEFECVLHLHAAALSHRHDVVLAQDFPVHLP